MEIQKLIQTMAVLEKLKCNTRHSWTSDGRHESVAEHSWRLAMLGYFVKDEFPQADSDKVILMCLCHDIGEAFTGDIPAFWKTAADEAAELKAIDGFLASLPQPFRTELTQLFAEMEAQESLEARIYKALDKMETLIQHNEADISTWLPLEYTKNLTYGENEVEFSEYMKQLKEEINRDTHIKINTNERT